MGPSLFNGSFDTELHYVAIIRLFKSALVGIGISVRKLAVGPPAGAQTAKNGLPVAFQAEREALHDHAANRVERAGGGGELGEGLPRKLVGWLSQAREPERQIAKPEVEIARQRQHAG